MISISFLQERKAAKRKLSEDKEYDENIRKERKEYKQAIKKKMKLENQREVIQIDSGYVRLGSTNLFR